jgi:hypothetical protein
MENVFIITSFFVYLIAVFADMDSIQIAVFVTLWAAVWVKLFFPHRPERREPVAKTYQVTYRYIENGNSKRASTTMEAVENCEKHNLEEALSDYYPNRQKIEIISGRVLMEKVMHTRIIEPEQERDMTVSREKSWLTA